MAAWPVPYIILRNNFLALKHVLYILLFFVYFVMKILCRELSTQVICTKVLETTLQKRINVLFIALS